MLCRSEPAIPLLWHQSRDRSSNGRSRSDHRVDHEPWIRRRPKTTRLRRRDVRKVRDLIGRTWLILSSMGSENGSLSPRILCFILCFILFYIVVLSVIAYKVSLHVDIDVLIIIELFCFYELKIIIRRFIKVSYKLKSYIIFQSWSYLTLFQSENVT